MPVMSGRPLFGNRLEPVYEALGHMPPGLIIDVGASNGSKCAIVLEHSPDSRIIAIEPFPPNVAMLRDRLGSDDRVQIMENAVSDKVGRVTFSVRETVKTATRAFAVGYSSLGMIVNKPNETAEVNLEVETVRIDDLLQDSSALMMKVDVQGGELGVLRSATKAITERRIDVIFTEFSGKINELMFLLDHGYFVFDGPYLLGPKTEEAKAGWDLITKEFKLSTGRAAYHAWPRQMPTSDEEYASFFSAQRNTYGSVIQTDLVAVSPRALGQFVDACMKMNNAV